MSKRKPPRAMSLLEAVEEEAAEAERSGHNRAVIIENKEEIEAVLARGYTWKLVWQALKRTKGVDMSYDTFRAHCRAAGLERAPTSSRFRVRASGETVPRRKKAAKKKATRRATGKAE